MTGRRWLVAAALFLALEGVAGCAGAPARTAAGDGATVCPEHRDLRCATARECSMDRARGCLVCACAAPSAASWPNGQLPSGVAPDRRQPQ